MTSNISQIQLLKNQQTFLVSDKKESKKWLNKENFI